MRRAMLPNGSTPAGATAPALSYASHRQRVVAAGFPAAVAVVLAMTALYAIIDLSRRPTGAQALTYALALAVPVGGLLLARTRLQRHAETVALGADLLFTGILAGRLLLPTTTLSGTALFLSLKLLATAVLWPWHPQIQYLSAALTLLAYYAALVASGRYIDETHQLVGPFIAAVLSCVGAAIADRTRRDLWQRTAALSDSEQRLRGALETERSLAAIAREIGVPTDLRTALGRINDLTVAAIGCEFSNTYLIDDARHEVAAAATNASEPQLREQILSLRTSLDLPLARELRAGRMVVINDPPHQSWIDPTELARDHIQALALTPIAAKGRVLGILTVTRTSRAAPFDDRELALLQAIAAQAAVAIDNARLFDNLSSSEARYRDLFERATDLIFVVDEFGGLRSANQAALDFVGGDAAQLRTLRWPSLVSEASRRQLERRLKLARHTGGGEGAVEIETCPPTGAPATLELRTRLISPPGQPRVFHCIARDVTERRRQECETRHLLHRLQEANRLQAEFVANMSHELRTPLNVIIGYADLLTDEPTLPRQSDAHLFLERISSAGRALHRMVESVLEYARMDRGRSLIIPRRFPATQLLRELRELGADLRGSATIAVRVQADADLALFTDYDRLYSILSNLLLNAMKFTVEGSVELTLRRVGDEAEFAVRDTGIGIDSDELTHVFEPFRQVDGSPTRSFGGVGLGLAIVRRNAALLRGTVEVESRLGVGSTFRVRLPLTLADRDEARASSAA